MKQNTDRLQITFPSPFFKNAACLRLLALMVFMGAALMFQASALHAQDILAPEQAPPDPQEIFVQLPLEIQNEIIDESIQVQEFCEAHPSYPTMYDCSCIALKFIDTRILEGPGQSNPVKVAQRHAASCKDAAISISRGFQLCANVTGSMQYGQGEYCECFARRYAIVFSNIESTSTRAERGAVLQALSYCDKETGLPR
jgi:hypothetical protein